MTQLEKVNQLIEDIPRLYGRAINEKSYKFIQWDEKTETLILTPEFKAEIIALINDRDIDLECNYEMFEYYGYLEIVSAYRAIELSVVKRLDIIDDLNFKKYTKKEMEVI